MLKKGRCTRHINHCICIWLYMLSVNWHYLLSFSLHIQFDCSCKQNRVGDSPVEQWNNALWVFSAEGWNVSKLCSIKCSLMASYVATKQKTFSRSPLMSVAVCSASQVTYSWTYTNPLFVWSSFPHCCTEKKLLTCSSLNSLFAELWCKTNPVPIFFFCSAHSDRVFPHFTCLHMITCRKYTRGRAPSVSHEKTEFTQVSAP